MSSYRSFVHRHRPKITLQALVGTELETWTIIAPTVLQPFVSEEIITALSANMRVYHLLKASSFDRYTLGNLQKDISTASEALVRAFAYKDKRLNFVNFHIHTTHWIEQILFTGTPISNSTQAFEALNKYCKVLSHSTNSIDILRDIMTRHNALLHLQSGTVLRGLSEEQLKRYERMAADVFPTHADKPEGHMVGPQATRRATANEIETLSQALNRDYIDPVTIQPYNAFILESSELRVGGDVQLGRSDRTPDNKAFLRDLQFVHVRDIFTVTDDIYPSINIICYSPYIPSYPPSEHHSYDAKSSGVILKQLSPEHHYCEVKDVVRRRRVNMMTLPPRPACYVGHVDSIDWAPMFVRVPNSTPPFLDAKASIRVNDLRQFPGHMSVWGHPAVVHRLSQITPPATAIVRQLATGGIHTKLFALGQLWQGELPSIFSLDFEARASRPVPNVTLFDTATGDAT
eukprot:TRINITY_DN1713_c0_g1_i2.p1 TRINITY_DN1713_c0_g1~~TRINITY_DN1713_c0_g1_i2.p1  ORF type:complete len:460 (+),score=90.99 TRINITY_DN1713_c0_g1_i2:277-1656(+)